MLKRTAILILTSTALLSGCVEKAPSVTQHEGDQRSPREEARPVDPDQTGMQVSQDLRARVDTSADPLIDVVRPLADKVFSMDRIQSARARVSEDAHVDLMNLNGLMLTLPERDRTRREYQDILQLYVMTLNLECEQIRGNCLGLRYLRTAGNTYAVLKVAAKLRPNDAARLLLFAVDMKNQLLDLELLELVITKVPPSLPDVEPSMRATISSFLDSSLAMAERTLQGADETRAFLERVHVWNLISGLEWQIGLGSTQALWRMVARARIIYGSDGLIAAPLKRMIDRANARSDSLFAQQEALRRSHLFHPEAIGGHYITNTDELFYLVDSVFAGRMIPESAAEVFLLSGRSAQDLADVIEAYARMLFAFAVRDSSLKAREIFNAPVPTEQLFFHSLSQAPQIKRIWGQTEASVDILRTFAALSVKAKPGGEEIENRLRKVLNSFGSSVTQVAVYPHTMLLFYYMGQKNFSISLPYVGSISTGDLMAIFFYGYWGPLLPYTDSLAEPNRFELLHAFDMAVRTNLFGLVGIDTDDFISDTFRRLTQGQVQHIEAELDLVTRRFQEARPMAAFRAACEEFKSGQKVPRVIDLGEIRTSAYYGDLLNTLFTGASSRGGTTRGEPGSIWEGEMGLMFADTELAEALERARLDLSQYLTLAEAMLTSYTSYLSAYEHLTPEQIEERTAKTRAEIARVKALQIRALTLTRQWFNEFGKCYSEIALKDWKIANKVLRMEEAFLRQVHRDIKKLRTPRRTEAEKAAIRASYELTGMPNDFKGQDYIGIEGYRPSQLNFFVRVSKYFSQGLRTETNSFPALAPHVTVNYGSAMTLDTPLVKNGEFANIMFQENEEEFVAEALRSYFSQPNYFVSWYFLGSSRMLAWDYYIKTLVLLYRLEHSLEATPYYASTDMILQAHEDYMKLSRFDEDERWVLGTLRRYNRVDLMSFDDKIVDYSSGSGTWALQSYFGLFDMPIIIVNREMLGYNYDMWTQGIDIKSFGPLNMPKRFGYQEMGQMYYSIRSKDVRGSKMIPFNPELDRMLDQSLRKVIQGEISAIRDFHREATEYINRAALRPPNERPYVDLTMDMRITSPVISEVLIHSWEASITQFNRNTQNCFVRQCEEFQ